jgi:preprotein translocase subunit SecG
MMCSKVKGKEKFLVLKVYNLLKDKLVSVNIEVGSFYFETLNANMHVMNKYTQTLSVLWFEIWLFLSFHKKNKIK